MKYTLKELRARNNLTQAKMAEKMGISRRRYIEIEQHPEKVACRIMLKIASILNVDIGDIFLPSNRTNSEVTKSD